MTLANAVWLTHRIRNPHHFELRLQRIKASMSLQDHRSRNASVRAFRTGLRR